MAPSLKITLRCRFLPPTRVQGGTLSGALVAEGCLIADARISNSVIGIRSIIGSNVVVRDTVMLGADYYEDDVQRAENDLRGRPDIGIGDGSIIVSAIIDKKARIGRNVQIRCLPDRPDSENDNWVVRDGLVVIPKSAAIPDNTII